MIFIFPGQGSQYVGMGKDFANHEMFQRANEALGFDLQKICLEGPEDELKLTQNTQPALLTYSMILFNELKEKGHEPKMVLGHSIGEISALCAAGVIDFEDAVLAVHKRGLFMQDAVPVGQGGMHAILKASDEQVTEACEAVSTNSEYCSVANFNSPGQVVISGHLEALSKVSEYLKEREVKFRAIPLPVSAPFHCALMDSAADKFKAHLEGIKFKSLSCPYVANIDAKEYSLNTNEETIKSNLIKQISGSVRWTQSLEHLPANSKVIEVGAGKVLKGLVKKTRSDLDVIALDIDGFEAV